MNFTKKKNRKYAVTKTGYFFLILISTLFIITSFTIKEKNTFEDSRGLFYIDSKFEAALVAPSGKLFFFREFYYNRYDMNKNKLIHSLKYGKKHWRGLPTHIDASVVHPLNKKAYFFKENTYYRFDIKLNKVDKKALISKNWKGVPNNVDAAIAHPTNNSIYFFKGTKYYRYSLSKRRVDRSAIIGVGGWKGVPTNVDIAFMGSNGKAYFFKGDFYYRYDFNKRKVDRKRTIKKGWKGLIPKLDAALFNDDHDNVHFFRGKNAMSLKVNKVLLGAADRVEHDVFKSSVDYKINRGSVGVNWYKGVPTSNIDAALRFKFDGVKKYLFFKGKKYYFWDPVKKVAKGNYIKDLWKGKVPNNLDAAVQDEDNGDLYLFKGDTYYQISINGLYFKKSGKIASRFKGIPNNIDAVRLTDIYGYFIFYKKSIYYKYSMNGGNKVEEKGTLPLELLYTKAQSFLDDKSIAFD